MEAIRRRPAQLKTVACVILLAAAVAAVPGTAAASRVMTDEKLAEFDVGCVQLYWHYYTCKGYPGEPICCAVDNYYEDGCMKYGLAYVKGCYAQGGGHNLYVWGCWEGETEYGTCNEANPTHYACCVWKQFTQKGCPGDGVWPNMFKCVYGWIGAEYCGDHECKNPCDSRR